MSTAIPLDIRLKEKNGASFLNVIDFQQPGSDLSKLFFARKVVLSIFYLEAEKWAKHDEIK